MKFWHRWTRPGVRVASPPAVIEQPAKSQSERIIDEAVHDATQDFWRQATGAAMGGLAGAFGGIGAAFGQQQESFEQMRARQQQDWNARFRMWQGGQDVHYWCKLRIHNLEAEVARLTKELAEARSEETGLPEETEIDWTEEGEG